MDRKGISSVIVSVLLVAVGLAVVSIYAQWAPTFAENVTSDFTDQTQEDIKCDNAGLSVREPVYDRTGQLFTYKIQNTGTIRFSGDVNSILVNQSEVVNTSIITGLEVEETREVQIKTGKIPDKLIVTPTDCPSVKASAGSRFIQVQK